MGFIAHRQRSKMNGIAGAALLFCTAHWLQRGGGRGQLRSRNIGWSFQPDTCNVLRSPVIGSYLQIGPAFRRRRTRGCDKQENNKEHLLQPLGLTFKGHSDITAGTGEKPTFTVPQLKWAFPCGWHRCTIRCKSSDPAPVLRLDTALILDLPSEG